MTELGETKEVILNENEEYLGIGQLMAGWDKKKTGPKKASAEKEKKREEQEGNRRFQVSGVKGERKTTWATGWTYLAGGYLPQNPSPPNSKTRSFFFLIYFWERVRGRGSGRVRAGAGAGVVAD